MNILIKCKKKLFLVCFCLLSISFAQAQQNIRGVVKDVQGEPIPGATVIEKGTMNGMTTDVNGQFSIQLINAQSMLTVSFVGYAAQELVPQANMVIVLQEDTQILDEVVVIGYGTIRKADLSGSRTNTLLGAGASIRIRGITTIGDSNPLTS